MFAVKTKRTENKFNSFLLINVDIDFLLIAKQYSLRYFQQALDII